MEVTLQSPESTDSTQDSNPNIQNSRNCAKLTVRDSGKGVAPEFYLTSLSGLAREKGDDTTLWRYGIGVSDRKEFVELQNGTIEVDNLPEGGARFTVEIP